MVIRLWQNVNLLTGYRRRTHARISKPIVKNNDKSDLIDTSEKINDILADNFIVKSSPIISEQELCKKICEYELEYKENNPLEEFHHVTPGEVTKAISDTKKDSYSDMYVPLAIFKKCKEIVSFQLVVLFTLIFKYCAIPRAFKATIVTPIYKKKGVKTCPSSYRPISCLNIYCKIFERILYH